VLSVSATLKGLGFASVFVGLLGIAGGVYAQQSSGAGQGSEHAGQAASDGGSEHGGRSMGPSGGMGMSMARHRFVRRNGVPEPYRSMENPLEPTDELIAQGKRVYDGRCATCHGESGRGDGPAGQNLHPQPTNIARFADMPMASDAYLYWTIAEGGAPVDSAMPPQKGALEAEEIWQVILYLRQM